MKRYTKNYVKRFRTSVTRNKGIVGDTIEIMLVKIKEGEGTEAISDRDLVYNDNESDTVNPITDIRSDKNELMLEEKIGEYEHKAKKGKTPNVEDKQEAPGEKDPSGN